MFSWFLKLLGIDEDRPASTGNTYLNSSSSSTAKEAEVKSAPAPVEASVEDSAPAAPEKIETPPEPESEPTPEPEKAAAEVEPAPESPPVEKTVVPEAAEQSLADAFPMLKANYAKVLEEAGFTSKELIDKAADKDLLALKGIGKATLKILRS